MIWLGWHNMLVRIVYIMYIFSLSSLTSINIDGYRDRDKDERLHRCDRYVNMWKDIKVMNIYEGKMKSVKSIFQISKELIHPNINCNYNTSFCN